MIKKTLTSILLVMTLFSCSKVKIESYKNQEPKLDIRQYLSGKVKAWGVLEDRKGKITRRFTVDMVGKWQGNKGVLEEDFIFDDGEKSRRVWRINFTDENNFTAKADDVIGEAKGAQYGNAMQMKYILDLKIDEKANYKVNLDDWMYLVDGKTLVNKSEIKKFGITFAKLTIFFQKIDE